MTSFTEDTLIEQPAIQLLQNLGWQSANCYQESFGLHPSLGRETPTEVVLRPRLRTALGRLNPSAPAAALEQALEELCRDRSSLGAVYANREVYGLLKDGVPVRFQDDEGVENIQLLRAIDWEEPGNNDFFLASQFWVSGEIYKRRCDLVGFVNGLPLVFIELKAAHKNLQSAYDGNLRDYRDTIPQLFWYNALVILSNGSHSRLGSFSAPWEHFSEWKKINAEGEEGVISLETILRGTCTPPRLLDLVENFVLFEEAKGGLRKITARCHQYLGVNNAFDSVRSGRKDGRLGVFWHTQGSGKSYSMVFFSQKVLRKLPGHWTFLIVTDRLELDDQIYKNFANSGVVTEPESRVRAASGEHLQQLLTEDHRFLFTLIQKFHIENGKTYPALSGRDDIIVMTDEAHRSQYDVLALNMRNALPRAAFLAFTGTPLMAGEEKTRLVFGDYVSIYNFKQSVEDQATVPLYYENRIPELQLTNPNLNDDMADLLDEADLDDRQEERLEREFRREYHLITRSDRLDKVAEDIVRHFLGRGFTGKAMVVSIDKATAVRMYDKVQHYWALENALVQASLADCSDEDDRLYLQARLKILTETDMAVVVSGGQNEEETLRRKGAEIRPHRIRMNTEDLATKFKDPTDPLRIVFVCAMWMTGFDAPACSTIYLDKPMKNHTLMQTIARANRVFGEKVNGLIVDYIGVFRDLQRALAIYGSGPAGETGTGDLPVEDKQKLVAALREAIADARAFLLERGVELERLQRGEAFGRVRGLDDAVDALLVNDQTKKEYLNLAGVVDRLFGAILPDKAANEFGEDRKTIVVLAEKIRNLLPPVDISGVMGDVDDLLDESIAPRGEGYRIRAQEGEMIAEPSTAHLVDLSKIDFDALRSQFENSRKHIEAEKLRRLISGKLGRMLQLNRARMDYYEQFQKMIEEYNSGAQNVDAFFAQLITLAQALNEEEQRGVKEQLSEEELAIFDILTRPHLKLSRAERQRVQEVARQLLVTLKAEYLVLDWRKHQTTRAGVQVAIGGILDCLPDVYDEAIYEEKCERVYQHIYDAYQGENRSVYTKLGRAA